ncbi:MAG: helix-turn-helix domain-containing protein [Blautia sp.]
MQQAPVIDMEQTGRRIQWLCKISGCSVREIQDYLHISSPQSIYNWFHGKTLPSVDNLYALSIWLWIPVNWFLIPKSMETDKEQKWMLIKALWIRRVRGYWGRLYF